MDFYSLLEIHKYINIKTKMKYVQSLLLHSLSSLSARLKINIKDFWDFV